MLFKNLVLLNTIAALVLSTACATGADPERMTVPLGSERKVDSSSQFRESLNVKNVSGGQETIPLWTSEISSSDFKQSLESSLDNFGYLDRSGDSKYSLEVTIQSVDQPYFGLSMKVDVKVKYRLIEKETSKVLLSKEIMSSYTAEFSESFFGFVRLKRANEGSARENIKKLIDSLRRLDIDRVALSDSLNF